LTVYAALMRPSMPAPTVHSTFVCPPLMAAVVATRTCRSEARGPEQRGHLADILGWAGRSTRSAIAITLVWYDYLVRPYPSLALRGPREDPAPPST
jgi:hypothetical protein